MWQIMPKDEQYAFTWEMLYEIIVPGQQHTAKSSAEKSKVPKRIQESTVFYFFKNILIICEKCSH